MNPAVQNLLNSFDALSLPEKQEAAVEIFRRVSSTSEGDVSDAALVEIAEELFLALDSEETRNAKR